MVTSTNENDISFLRDVRQILPFILPLAGLAALLGIGGESWLHHIDTIYHTQRYAIYEQFGQEADKNRDGDLIESELQEVYHLLGLNYDARTPMSLSREQMVRYIELGKETGN